MVGYFIFGSLIGLITVVLVFDSGSATSAIVGIAIAAFIIGLYINLIPNLFNAFFQGFYIRLKKFKNIS